jgi:hypothetical protein
MNRDRRIVVIEGTGEPQRGDGRTKAPAEMTQPLDEMRRQPEIIGAQLPVILPLTECGVGKRLAVGVDELVFLQLIVEGQGVKEHVGVLDP